MLKMLFAGVLTAALTGCGIGYVPSSVSKTSDYVRVVQLDFESVLIANRSSYSPRELPAVFHQAGGSSNMAGAMSRPSAGRQQLLAPPAADPGPYRIGVGDVLAKIDAIPPVANEALGLPSNRQSYRVQQDGTIAVPEVGRIMVAGLTADEAEAAVFRKLVEGQANPSASLQIDGFNSQSISVGGAVGRAGNIPLTETPLTLDSALSAAGGVAAIEPDGVVIRIFRDNTRYQIPLTDYLTQARLQKTRLLNGDSVFVDLGSDVAGAVSEATVAKTDYDISSGGRDEARRNFEARKSMDAVERDYVYLAGEVATPGRFEMPYGRQTTLADALYSMGGYKNETANPSQIYVLRGSPDPADFGAVTAWHLNARDAANFVVATRMQMRPNDVVFIAEQPVTKWNRVIQQLVPSLLTSGATIAAR